MTYQEKLKDPRWQKKRLEILERDEWRCQHCHDKEKTLHVHHKFYEKDKDPWEYEIDMLVTLCDECHKDEGSDMYKINQSLLKEVRRYFDNSDIVALYSGFNKLKLSRNSNLVSSALSWALSNPDMQEKLINDYLRKLGNKK